MATPWDWLVNMPGAGEMLSDSGFRVRPRARLGILKVGTLDDLGELLDMPNFVAENDQHLGEDRFTGLAAVSIVWNYKMDSRTQTGTGRDLPEGAGLTGIQNVLTTAHETCAPDRRALGVYAAGPPRPAATRDASAHSASTQSAASLKRARKKESLTQAATPAQLQAVHGENVSRVLREYGKYCRVAAAAFFGTNQDYHGGYLGCWRAPTIGTHVSFDKRWTLNLDTGPAEGRQSRCTHTGYSCPGLVQG